MILRLPRVVIVGFPNAGKSTLFNRLLREKKSLVHSLPGMTRDCVWAPCILNDHKFVLVDTGGLFESADDPLSSRVKEKAWVAAEKANLILFVLDGKKGLLPAEEDLFRTLKKLGRPVLVAVNKIDTESQEQMTGDYHRLGEEHIYFISAEHKRNLDVLETAIIEALPAGFREGIGEEEVKPLKIALIGRINVGKSSLANRLCGEERLIVSELPGTTRDSTDILIRREGKAFRLIDTAGIRKLGRTLDERESAGVIKAKKNIPRADVLCLILDAQEFPTRQDTAVARLAYSSGKPLIIALNKWDLFQGRTVSSDMVRDRVFSRLDFISFAPLITISALTGKRVVRILDLAETVYHNSLKRIETSVLNKFIAAVNESHPPLSKARKRFKIKYITQKGVQPPTFILFTSSRVSFFPSYEKFLIHQIRQKFGFWGTPVRFILRSS
ncbi:MAG: ribosome biogenesis GTPase Der [Candidatus Aminicenantales bacterium]